MNGGSDSADIVRAAVECSLGPEATITKLEDSAVIELLDLDAMASPDEVLEALARDTGVGSSSCKILSIRKAFGGA